MIDVHEPQGPLPREVYVRRRAIAGGIAALVVLAVVLALYLASNTGGTDTTAENGEQTTGQAGGEGAADADGENGTDGEGADPDATTTTTSPARDEDDEDAGRCEDDDLRLTVWPAEPNARAGEQLRFYMQIENTSDRACTRDLNSAPLAFEVYELDSNAKVWSSIDCTPPAGSDEVELRPGAPEARQIDWSGRVSEVDRCTEADRTPAPVGNYQVYALVGDLFSPAATFNIVE